MSKPLGPVNVSGDAVERTHDIVIQCPFEGRLDPQNDYKFIVHREIIVTKQGEPETVLEIIRDADIAHARGYTDFKNEWCFSAGQALAIKPGILDDIVGAVEALIAAGVEAG